MQRRFSARKYTPIALLKVGAFRAGIKDNCREYRLPNALDSGHALQVVS